MPSKLALLSVVTPHAGPWMVADGSERSVELVGSVCDVVLECTKGDEIVQSTLSPDKQTEFPLDVSLYRVVRQDNGSSPVTVRVHIT